MYRAPVFPAAQDLLLILDVDEVPSAKQFESLRRGDAAMAADCCRGIDRGDCCCDVIRLPLQGVMYDLGCQRASSGGAFKIADSWGYVQRLHRFLALAETNATGREAYWATV